MDRLTRTVGKGIYAVDESNIQHGENGYYGEAVTRLAKFENICEDLKAKQLEISKELEKLRLEGKTNTVKFRQLLTNKLANSNVLILFKSYGLEE